MKYERRRVARQLHRRNKKEGQTELWTETTEEPIWQERFYDFNVWSEKKECEKLSYMHGNPVKRGLVAKPDQWRWSSYRSYAYGERGAVRINYQERPAVAKQRSVGSAVPALSQKARKDRAPRGLLK